MPDVDTTRAKYCGHACATAQAEIIKTGEMLHTDFKP